MYRNKRNNVLLEIQFKRFENNDFIIAEQAEICLPDTPIHFFPFFAVFLFIIKASGTSKALGIYLYHPHPCMIFLYVIYNDFRRRIAPKCPGCQTILPTSCERFYESFCLLNKG